MRMAEMNNTRFGNSEAAKYLADLLNESGDKNHESLVSRNLEGFTTMLKNINQCGDDSAKVRLSKMCYREFCDIIGTSSLPDKIKTLTLNVLHIRHANWLNEPRA